MNLITKKKIINKKNVLLKSNLLKKENDILLSINMGYSSYSNDYIYFKKFYGSDSLYDDETRRFNLNNPYEPVLDNDFILKMDTASHNMYFFNDKNGDIKSIGGQHLGIDNIEKYRNNSKYKIFFDKVQEFIDSRIYGFNMWGGSNLLYNHKNICPFYSNGLHLFNPKNYDSNNNSIECLNNGLPVLSGLNNGYDAHYGSTNNSSITNSRNGLTVYDSMGSVVYNKNNGLYYLYHRANIGTGVRTIQYATSVDLLSWSEYNLVSFYMEDDNVIDYFRYNIYYSNFFNLPNTNIFIGILPLVKKPNSDYGSFENINNMTIFYSYDCINYYYIDVLISHQINFIGQIIIASNYPKIYKDKMFLYINDQNKKNLSVYSLEKDRFFYISNIDDKNESEISLQLLKINGYIKLGFNMEEDGYIKVQIEDENKQIIDGYSYNDFLNINNYNSNEYILKWNNKDNIFNTNIYVNIKFLKAKIFSINGEFI